MLYRPPIAALLVVLACAAPVQAQPAREASRGELLYSTHCLACHTTRMHWREQKIVIDWKGLRSEVRRWQATALLGWSDEDIAEVARYLDALYYHLPGPG